MTNPLTARLTAAERDQTHKNVRPSDAATLLVLDTSRGGLIRVLMGKRHMRHKFFPGAFVFPGGKVDPTDSRVKLAGDYHPEVLAKLMHDMRGSKTATRARAFGVAALRETYEEAGLFIGAELGGAAPARGKSFVGFEAAGVMPSLASFRFVARAITPPRRSRRFDTRFFACWADAIAGKTVDGLGPSGELEDIAWLTFDEAKKTEIPQITMTILDEVAARLEADPKLDPSMPVPFYRWVSKGFERTLI